MPRSLPPSEYPMRPNEHLLPAGADLWRMHSTKRPAAQFNPTLADPHFGGSRFDGTASDPYGYLYLADTPTTALAETLLRELEFDTETGMRLVPYAAVAGKSLTKLHTRCELRLVSLVTAADLAAVCQDTSLLEAEGDQRYPTTRRWASEIRAQTPKAMGLLWQSRRNRPHLASVLFHDRCPDEPLAMVTSSGVPDLGSRAGLEEVNQLLAPLRAAIVQPWAN